MEKGFWVQHFLDVCRGSTGYKIVVKSQEMEIELIDLIQSMCNVMF